MIKKRYIFLQATTSPYRTELFNVIHEEGARFNVEITVFYYRKMMGDRSWKFDPIELKHPHKIFNAFEFFIKNYPFYFSLSILRDLRKQKVDELILGVSWNDFIILKIVLLKRLGIIKNKLHFWTEANYMAGGMKKNYRLLDAVRSWVFGAVDGQLLIPGKIAEKTIRDYWNLQHDVLLFPNTVKIDYSTTQSIDLAKNKINVLIVARLNEKIKGVLNFIKSIDKRDLEACHFYIAGDGPDRVLYEDFIKINNFTNITMLGAIEREKVLSYYKSSDLFVLPSFSDPNPLSVIEALNAKLPLFISNQCGNVSEAVINGFNGFSFDPYNKYDIWVKFKDLILNKENFSRFGNNSFVLANKYFNYRNVVHHFLEKFS